MRLDEFQKYIDKCSNYLWDCKDYGAFKNNFLCHIFSPFWGVELPKYQELIEEFTELAYESDYPNGPQGVFGKTTDFDNQADRFIMLYLFEQYCIDTELYKRL